MPDTPIKATREEVEALKKGWLRDPCYDLSDLPDDDYGQKFMPYKDELIQFEADTKTRREEERITRNKREAEQLGLSAEQYEVYSGLIYNAANTQKRAANLLTHYFTQSLPHHDSDTRAELENLVEFIIDSAVYKVQAELMKQKK